MCTIFTTFITDDIFALVTFEKWYSCIIFILCKVVVWPYLSKTATTSQLYHTKHAWFTHIYILAPFVWHYNDPFSYDTTLTLFLWYYADPFTVMLHWPVSYNNKWAILLWHYNDPFGMKLHWPLFCDPTLALFLWQYTGVFPMTFPMTIGKSFSYYNRLVFFLWQYTGPFPLILKLLQLCNCWLMYKAK